MTSGLPTIPVLTGSCGWTDDTIFKCGRFYPRSARTAVDRLRHYSRFFSCVEIDTSTYAIPRPHQVREWMAEVPKGFLFAIKIFGLFASRHVAPGALPRDLRAAHLSPEQEAQTTVRLSELSPALVDALWQRMNEVIAELHQGGMLSVVVFQFHVSFDPSPDNICYVAECRRRLWHQFPMAVEFRNRKWYSLGAAEAVLPHRLYSELGIETQPASDKLQHDGPAAAGAGLESSSSSCTSSALSLAPASLEADLTCAVASGGGLAKKGHDTGASADPAPFRNQKSATLYFMRRTGIVNIPSDDLASEMPPHDAAQPSFRDGR